MYQPELALYRQLENPLGQAKTLRNIGSVYVAQGEEKEALKQFRQVRALYLKYGFDPSGRWFMENLLERLHSDEKTALTHLAYGP